MTMQGDKEGYVFWGYVKRPFVWMATRSVGDLVLLIISLAVTTIPFAYDHKFLFFKASWWLYVWLAFLILKEISDRYKLGRATEANELVLANIHATLGGSIDSITQRLIAVRGSGLSEADARDVCIMLLARVSAYVYHALTTNDGVRIRTTLSVPIGKYPNGRSKSLRTWCYDKPYGDRRWTTFRLPESGLAEEAAAGAPKAFLSGDIQVIRDLQALEGVKDAKKRQFRSILSIPVRVGGPSGGSIAVLNLDVVKPNFFKEALVERKVLPLVTPALNLLEMVLLLRDPEAKYVFNQ